MQPRPQRWRSPPGCEQTWVLPAPCREAKPAWFFPGTHGLGPIALSAHDPHQAVRTSSRSPLPQAAPRISLVAQTVKCLPARQKTWVQSLGQEDPLEKEMATHCSTLAWEIPGAKESGRLQSMGSQRIGHNWATSLSLSHPNCGCHTPSLSPVRVSKWVLKSLSLCLLVSRQGRVMRGQPTSSVCVRPHSLQSWLTLCNPVICRPPGSSVYRISQTKTWSELPCLPPGDLPNPGIKPVSPALQDSYPLSHLGSPPPSRGRPKTKAEHQGLCDRRRKRDLAATGAADQIPTISLRLWTLETVDFGTKYKPE